MHEVHGTEHVPAADRMSNLLRVVSETGGANLTQGIVPYFEEGVAQDLRRIEQARQAVLDATR